MTNDENIENEREYSINWISLLIKVVIFAILLVLLVWVISKLTTKDCKTLTDDYYVVSSFTDSEYNNKGNSDTYESNYTIKLLNINTKNTKDVSVKTDNYFHTNEEYDGYIKNKNKNLEIINQTNNNLVVDNSESLRKSSLTAKEFEFDVSEIYEFENEYYLDIKLKIKDHSNITAYSDSYFVPIHIVVEYTESNNCREK